MTGGTKQVDNRSQSGDPHGRNDDLVAETHSFAFESSSSTLGRLTQRVADNLGEAIVTGKLKAHEVLPVEADLIHQYGASRSVLREAVKVLNAKGLVAAKPRRGTTVQPIDTWNLFDPDVLRWVLARNFSLDLLVQFTEIRFAIEPQAAALACRAANDADLARVRAGFERMEAAAKGADDPLKADIDFHLAILDASHNLFFARLKALVEAALHFSIRYTDNIARDENAKIAVHEKLLRAIETRDDADARHASESLLNDVLSMLRDGQQTASR